MFPELLHLGSFINIPSLWVVISLGLIISLISLFKTMKRKKINYDFLWKYHLLLIAASLIFARLAFLIKNFEDYPPLSENIKNIRFYFFLWDKGLSLWGGILGFIFTFIILALTNEQNIKKWADIFIHPFLIFLIFCDIGDLLGGTNYGIPTSLPWGISFLNNINIKYTVPVHPVQIYSFICTLGIIILLSRYLKNYNFFKSDGALAVAGISLLSLCSFLNNFLRGDDSFVIFYLRVEQFFSLAILIASTIYLYRKYKKYLRTEPKMKDKVAPDKHLDSKLLEESSLINTENEKTTVNSPDIPPLFPNP